ncbi:MAG TPA: YkvA family protein [Polyangiaceae bacterium]|nr:YkvA family protein [Polyangiaceae bacterium]
MSTLEERCLDAFPNWLRSLSDDARALSSLLESERPEGAGASVSERRAASALNYLFKSLDLIPDGLEDLGFIDDAFVVRAAADAVRLEAEAELSADATGTLARLAGEAELIQEFLGSEYGRLSRYVAGLEQSSVRGRTVATILSDAGVRADFAREVREWAEGYVVPGFTRDQRNLVKLRSFLLAKLPA